jgi:FkbM family methyltransferase
MVVQSEAEIALAEAPQLGRPARRPKSRATLPRYQRFIRTLPEGLSVPCLQRAIASSTGHTRLVDPGIGAWGYRTDPSGAGPDVPTVTVSQVFQEYGEPLSHPFLVKFDIEGGERDLFEGDTSWVERTAIVVVDLHD